MALSFTRRDWIQATATATLASAMSPRLFGATRQAKAPIRVAQIGVGHGHATKLSVYRQSPDYEVVGIAEPNVQLRQDAEQEAAFRDLHWYTVEQLLNDDSIQVILVEAQVRDLLGTAEKCIAAGKHIHLDKPAGESWSHLQKILTEAERRRRIVQMGYMYRYNPAIILLRQFLREKWLGEIFEIQAVMSKVVEPSERRELAEYPGGTMFELGCHLLDLVVQILGVPTRVVPFAQRTGLYDDRLKDNMLAVLEYPHALATIKSSAQEVDGFERRHLTICGTNGTFHIQPLDDPAVRLTLADARGDYATGYQTISLPEYTRYVDDAADMARIVRGEKESDYSYAHDLAVQKVVLQASGLPLEP